MLWIGGCFVVLAIALIGLGAAFGKDDNEKLSGLSEHYDVSSTNIVAYVMYQDGQPELHLYHLDEQKDTKVFELGNDKLIFDPTFSKDSTSLAFISTNKDLEKGLKSTVHLLNLDSNEVDHLFTRNSGITEIAFSPEESSLFYLDAATFENYSPIAGKRLHDFDIYEYQFNEDQHIQKTDMKHYEIGSLTIGDDHSLFFQKMDDEHVKTADDVFNSVQRIFKVPAEDPDQLHVVSNPEREVDIYDFTLLPNEKEFIFQSISNSDSGGTFQYELYEYNVETKEEKQLTTLGEYAAHPISDAEMEKIYFMVDKRFAKRDSDYHLYRMNRDGSDIEEVPLGEG